MIDNKENNFISVVAYVHNSKDVLCLWLDMIAEFLETHFLKYELILVNDFSTDESTQLVKKWMSEKDYSHMVSIVNMSYYHGLELSMGAGIDLAIGDFVYEFDDLVLDYDVELIGELYQKSLQGYDIVAASPMGRTDIFSKIFYKIYNGAKESTNNYKLMRETFRIISRRAINRVNALSDSVPYRKALYLNSGLPYSGISYKPREIVIKNYDRKQKKKRMNLAVDSLMLFTNIVYKISLFISIVFLIFAFLTVIYTIISYLGNNKPIEGWTPIMGFLATGFFGIFMMLTIIIKYLSLVLNMIFNKQDYMIQSIDKITK